VLINNDPNGTNQDSGYDTDDPISSFTTTSRMGGIITEYPSGVLLITTDLGEEVGFRSSTQPTRNWQINPEIQ
jgi:hypothetical protein